MDAPPTHPAPPVPATPTPGLGAPEIRAEALSKDFDGKVVLNAIDATIHAGEIVCVVGASGSGKTVLLSHLIGLMKPSSGRVLAADHNAGTTPGAGENGGPGAPAGSAPPLRDINAITADELDLIRLHWAVVFQRNALFSGSVRDNVALWLREHTTLGAEEIDGLVRESVKAAALDVKDVLDKDRDALSGGMAKRVAIARAIAADPLVLFYDEPTTGLDPIIGAQIHELIWDTHHRPVGRGFTLRDLGDRRPARTGADARTTIVVTHDKDLLRRVAPRVVMLDKSRVVFDGPYEAFQTSDEPAARAYLADMPALHARESW